METEKDPSHNWAAQEVWKIGIEKQRLFKEAHAVFHVIFYSIIVFIVLLYLYHLTEALYRRQSLKKVVEQQRASCHCSIRMPHQEGKQPPLSSTRSSSSAASLFPGRSPYRPHQTARPTTKSLFLQQLQI